MRGTSPLAPESQTGILEELYEHLLYEEMQSIRFEEMVRAGTLIPPYEEEDLDAYLAFTQRYDEWKEKMDRELREKGDLE